MDEVDAPKILAGQSGTDKPDASTGGSLTAPVVRRVVTCFCGSKQARTVDIEVDFDSPETTGRGCWSATVRTLKLS